MGILDSLKKATRIGLSHDQFYNLAYEQGVLVNNWAEAANLFAQAAERYQKLGNQPMVHRALANQALYLYAIAHKNKTAKDRLQYAQTAVPHLQAIPEIEVPGSQTNGMPTQPLVDELLGYRYWILADTTDTVADKVRYHTEASQYFDHIGESMLVFETAMSARDPYFFHTACATYYQAHLIADRDPQAAVEQLQEAYNSFQNCSIRTEIADQVLNEINELGARETCWFCGRELQGNHLHFKYYAYRATPYAKQVFDTTLVDAKPLTRPDQGIPLCVICGSALEALADAIAEQRTDALRSQVNARLKEIAQTQNQLIDAVNNLQRVAHHH